MEGQVRFARFRRDDKELGVLVDESELKSEVEVSLHPDRIDGYPNPNPRGQNTCAHRINSTTHLSSAMYFTTNL